ncbi:hypothetical protein V6255_11285 [Psychromonas arctica]|uniref:Uncharacterized protein n=1 Tax=Psychromonas arctica TaxID=168275 RepID=A0ABU9HDS3_9GAMM
MKLVTGSIIAGSVACLLSLTTLIVLTLNPVNEINNTFDTEVVSKKKEEQQAIGEMVQQLQIAINSPTDGNALQTISKFGTDSRYYLMVRGWLVQKVRGTESRLQAQKSQSKREVLVTEVDALKQAIRAIDLE